MIDYETISTTAQKLLSLHGILSAEDLCKVLDIEVQYLPMGATDKAIRSFVLRSSRCFTIVVNSDLSYQTQQILIYHEVGHVVLRHCEKTGLNAFHDFDIYSTSQFETEANCFIAEYLMNTNETISMMREGRSFECICGELSIPPQILDFKVRIMKYYGLLKKEVDTFYGSTCLGTLDCGLSSEDYYD